MMVFEANLGYRASSHLKTKWKKKCKKKTQANKIKDQNECPNEAISETHIWNMF